MAILDQCAIFAIGLNGNRIYWVFELIISPHLKLAIILTEITLFAVILPVWGVENTEINGRLWGKISLY